MPVTSTISRKGRITVPVEVRRRLGLKQGERVEFAFEDGRTVLRPAQQETNPFAAFVGILPAFSSREEINAWYRELRDDDPWVEQKPEEGRQ
jgi:AbrB family looped-hinge helix DNA binding protein